METAPIISYNRISIMDESTNNSTNFGDTALDDLDSLDLGELDLDMNDPEVDDPTLPVVEDVDLDGSIMDTDLGDLGGDGLADMDDTLPEAPLSEYAELTEDDNAGMMDLPPDLAEVGDEDEEDLEPVALSEEELENILGDSSEDDVLSAPIPETDQDESDEAESVDVLNDEDMDLPVMELDDADLELDDTELDQADLALTGEDDDELGEIPDLGLDSLGDEDDLHIADDLSADMDMPAGLMEDHPGEGELGEEDEGPVTLSEDELGSILDDVDPGEEIYTEGEDPGELELSGADFSDDGNPLMPEAASVDASVGEDEEITLSEEELSSVLLDTDDLPPAPPELGAVETSFDEPAAEEVNFEVNMNELEEEPLEAPPLSALDMEDEDEPITLTAEELGNIVSDVEGEEHATWSEGEGDDMAVADEPPPMSILEGGDDDGPVALSENELDAILEDVDEAAPLEGMDEQAPLGLEAEMGEDQKNVIVLDNYDDSAIAAGATAATTAAAVAEREESPVIERVAGEQGVDKTELRKMISYLDQLFDRLPDETVREFSKSEYFDLYKKIMSDLDI